MTKKDLEKFGVHYVGSKVYPNRFFVPQIGEINLYEPYSFEYILKEVYDKAYEHGTLYGEAKKAAEVRKVLNIEEQ